MRFAALAIVCIACGGTSSQHDAGLGGGTGGSGGGSATGGGAGGCSVVFSGAVTGTQGCSVSMNTTSGKTTVQYQTPSATMHTQSLTGSLVLTGAPSATSYTDASPTVQSRLEVTVNDAQTWGELYNSSDPASETGLFTLTFTTVGTFDSLSGLYAGMHGSLSATATAAGAADCVIELTF